MTLYFTVIEKKMMGTKTFSYSSVDGQNGTNQSILRKQQNERKERKIWDFPGQKRTYSHPTYYIIYKFEIKFNQTVVTNRFSI